MAEPSAFAFSQLISDLTGRKVAFTATAPAPETQIKQIYGVYKVLPWDSAIVLKADLPLLGSFAGLLVGLPDAAVKERLRTTPVDELLRDAIHECLNICSTVVTTEGRAVFKSMATDRTYVDGAAGEVLKNPGHRSHFNVTIEGYQGGKMAVLAPIISVLPRH